MKNGFRKARHDVIAALESGNYLHVARGDIEVKNLLAMGEVTAEVLIRVIRSCSGVHHHCSPHHAVLAIDVHVLKRLVVHQVLFHRARYLVRQCSSVTNRS